MAALQQQGKKYSQNNHLGEPAQTPTDVHEAPKKKTCGKETATAAGRSMNPSRLWGTEPLDVFVS